MSSRQLVGPLSVWQLTVIWLIFAGLRPESARCRSRIPFSLGSTLAKLFGSRRPGGWGEHVVTAVGLLGIVLLLGVVLGSGSWRGFLGVRLLRFVFLVGLLRLVLLRITLLRLVFRGRAARLLIRLRGRLVFLGAQTGHREIQVRLTHEAAGQRRSAFKVDALDLVERDADFRLRRSRPRSSRLLWRSARHDARGSDNAARGGLGAAGNHDNARRGHDHRLGRSGRRRRGSRGCGSGCGGSNGRSGGGRGGSGLCILRLRALVVPGENVIRQILHRDRGRLGRTTHDQDVAFDRGRVGVDHVVEHGADHGPQAINMMGADGEVAHQDVHGLGPVAVGHEELDRRHVHGTESHLAEIARAGRLRVLDLEPDRRTLALEFDLKGVASSRKRIGAGAWEACHPAAPSPCRP